MIIPLWLRLILSLVSVKPEVKIAIQLAWLAIDSLPAIQRWWAKMRFHAAADKARRTNSPEPVEKLVERYEKRSRKPCEGVGCPSDLVK